MDILTIEVVGQHLGVLPLGAVDDPTGEGATLIDKVCYLPQLFPLPYSSAHGYVNVGSIKVTDNLDRISQLQLIHYVLTGCRISCRSECDDRVIGISLLKKTELRVLRPEVVSPLTDTVCLIYGKERDLSTPQDVLPGLGHQGLGADVEQLQLPLEQKQKHLTPSSVRHRAIDRSRGDVMTIERINLISHQGYEWRDHNGAPITQKGRKLIADGLTASGRQNDQLITTLEEVSAGFFLIGSESIVPKRPLQRLLKCHPFWILTCFCNSSSSRESACWAM